MALRIAIVGGGAAGYFGAIAAASLCRDATIELFEAATAPLQKVRISGGGRCNVTHAAFEPKRLVEGYPRGARELLGPFTRFGPRETVDWFESRGVPLKTESDGRVFPVSDRSSSIVDCLEREAASAGVRVQVSAKLTDVRRTEGGHGFELTFAGGRTQGVDRLLVATGGNPAGHRFAASLGHSIVPAVPSLFTFNVADGRLAGLAGISFERVGLTLTTGTERLIQAGPMLITHWGLSGPAVLKLSAWGARALAASGYRAQLDVNFAPDQSRSAVRESLASQRASAPARRVRSDRPPIVPARYWARLVDRQNLPADAVWSQVSTASLTAMAEELSAARFEVSGRGVFKEEFVTAGGVTLAEVDFRSMQSRVAPGLYLAGEILDIDGITGGFNFQSAWTTGWTAGMNIV